MSSIVDLRYRMKDVLRAIDRGEMVSVLYRGVEKARLVPVGVGRDASESPGVRAQDQPFFGLWKDRDDLADPVAYVRKLRAPRTAAAEKPTRSRSAKSE